MSGVGLGVYVGATLFLGGAIFFLAFVVLRADRRVRAAMNSHLKSVNIEHRAFVMLGLQITKAMQAHMDGRRDRLDTTEHVLARMLEQRRDAGRVPKPPQAVTASGGRGRG